MNVLTFYLTASRLAVFIHTLYSIVACNTVNTTEQSFTLDSSVQ